MVYWPTSPLTRAGLLGWALNQEWMMPLAFAMNSFLGLSSVSSKGPFGLIKGARFLVLDPAM